MQFSYFSLHYCIRIELVTKSETNATSTNETDRDEQQPFTTTYQEDQTSENFTGIKHAPLVAPLERDDTENELRKATVFDTVDRVHAAASNVPSIKNLNDTALAIGAVNIQIANMLQRNATVSRDQLSSRAVIKWPSTSASANNNTAAVQKHNKPDAPMLNYIFDSHLTNKHRHYDPRYVSLLSPSHFLANCNIISCLNAKFMRIE